MGQGTWIQLCMVHIGWCLEEEEEETLNGSFDWLTDSVHKTFSTSCKVFFILKFEPSIAILIIQPRLL